MSILPTGLTYMIIDLVSDFFGLLEYPFYRRAMITGFLASIVFGIVGTYVVIKRIVFISDGIAHASFGGIGLAFFLSHHLIFSIDPLMGAAVFALISAIGIGLMSKKKVQREDTAIGIIWVLGMALGALFFSLTPGYQTSMENVLFGNIYMISNRDIYMLSILVICVLAAVFLFYHELQAVSFDEEFAEVTGIRTTAFYLFLLIIVALSIVFLLRFVGIILVIALFTMPASIASGRSHDIKKIMFYSWILSLIFVIGGLFLSYVFDLASGPTITLFGGSVFVIYTLASWMKE